MTFSQATTVNSEDVYSEEFRLDSYRKHLENSALSIPDSRPNVILLVVESLSTIDSLRSGGLRNNLPKLDELTKKGLLFTNYISNAHDSETAFVSMFCQIPTLLYPGSSVSSFYSYRCFQDNAFKQLKSAGYHTSLFKLAPLGFGLWSEYFSNMNLDILAGRDDIDRFKKAPKFVFRSPPDEYLYKEILSRIDEKQISEPYFVSALTISTHFPYHNPGSGRNTYEGVLSYAEDQILEFYNELEKRNFFNNGILVIVGDHRVMAPLKKEDFQHFGVSAEGRIFLSAIGTGLSENVIDNRLLQQSDLLKSILDYPNISGKLSPYALFPLRRDYANSDYSNVGKLLVVEQNEDRTLQNYLLEIRDKNLSWETKKQPKDLASANEYINSVRAVSEYVGKYSEVPSWCRSFSETTELLEKNKPDRPGVLSVLVYDAKAKELSYLKNIENENLKVDYHLFNSLSTLHLKDKNSALVFYGTFYNSKGTSIRFFLEGDADACLFINGTLVTNLGDVSGLRDLKGRKEYWLKEGNHDVVMVVNNVPYGSFVAPGAPGFENINTISD